MQTQKRTPTASFLHFCGSAPDLRARLCVLAAAVESDSREALVELRNLSAGVDKAL